MVLTGRTLETHLNKKQIGGWMPFPCFLKSNFGCIAYCGVISKWHAPGFYVLCVFAAQSWHKCFAPKKSRVLHPCGPPLAGPAAAMLPSLVFAGRRRSSLFVAGRRRSSLFPRTSGHLLPATRFGLEPLCHHSWQPLVPPPLRRSGFQTCARAFG
jgi:hypothetical protein